MIIVEVEYTHTVLYILYSESNTLGTALKKDKSEEFTNHLNSIEWTSESETMSQVQAEEEDVATRTERALAFLDTLTILKPEDH